VTPDHIPAAVSAAYPVRGGNLVRPLIGGTAAFRRIAEAVDAARHSVWLTVAFYDEDLCFPGGRGTLFDLLDRAAGRGVEVRAIFWRHSPETSAYGRTFWGTAIERDRLRARNSRVRIRWDRAAVPFCQHQKSWMIDAGMPSETAFVGGINLTAKAIGRHDAYVEVTGPSATDVQHNFVERWNGASERHAPDGNWACDSTDQLPLPSVPSGPRGTSTVQIQRMLYRGERSILEQYERAIDAARRTIYIENQAIPIPRVAACLERALARGVEVVLLVPAIPEEHVYAARQNPERRTLFDGVEALGRHPGFRLAGIAALDGRERRPVYVHCKLMIVDDAWTTIGSCNLHANSLGGQTEMNASIWDAAVACDLRCALFLRHLGVDTTALDDVEALRLYRRIADTNGSAGWQGEAFTLDPRKYAVA
jgi:phosphatidylserine/phosphatidylglycerophosphate/cardiolipin synthase-like enzyme